MAPWKIVAISDTHCQHNAINMPEGDVVVHAGDATYRGTIPEMEAFAYWYGNLPYRLKVYTAGNHDWLCATDRGLAKEIMRHHGIVYLQDEAATLYLPDKERTLQVYGTPHSPIFFDWAFNEPEERLKMLFEAIPAGLDILITHTPPHGILDEVTEDFKVKYLGCHSLLDVVQERKPKYQVFGHIHQSYGQRVLGSTTFINASTCNAHYKPVNAPIVFEIR